MSMPQVTLAGKSVGRIGYGLMQRECSSALFLVDLPHPLFYLVHLADGAVTWNPKPPAEDVSFAAMK